MKSAEIREIFLRYFEKCGHHRVASHSLVPHNDPTLLFTNAGMVPFKEIFLGHQCAPYTRAVSVQRCVRAGGKHNDLENVGYTARHHTFFEMLGNFSFGDYFKSEAIAFAWEFLTSEDYLGIPADKLIVTVYTDDQESYRLWRDDIGLPQSRIIVLGDKQGAPQYTSDNFWSMGDTGPCGPCTEIFYDHGPHVTGGPPGSPDENGDRFVEIWNIVFMQFNRHSDGTLVALPKPSVDTGMGLERMAAVMQGVHNNYDTDLFTHLLHAAGQLLGVADRQNPSLRVIADHIRACAFLISDGVVPDNEGRGYVLRRIIRRAVRHGHKLGAQNAFFHQLLLPLLDTMQEAYPELLANQASIEEVLLAEEQKFASTLQQGLNILETDLLKINNGQIPGAVLFKLYDTYGFPVDLTADIARERGLTIDLPGFEQAMQTQRDRARHASHFTSTTLADGLELEGGTQFTGYQTLRGQCRVIALFKADQPVNDLAEGESGIVVLAETPFYAESGGQVGDQGVLQNDAMRFITSNTTQSGDHHLHHGTVAHGGMSIGDILDAIVDAQARQATALNHSATHLLHAALRSLLGDQVKQQGSLVDAQRLRFDFSASKGLTSQQLQTVEALVNEHIRRNTPIETQLTTVEDAKKHDAMMLFDEKYREQVRMLTMGDGFSVELCGGTHARYTGDIGLMKIIAETGIAAGVRRIEAVTGHTALRMCQQTAQQVATIASLLNTPSDTFTEKVQQLIDCNKTLDKENTQLKDQLARAAGSHLAAQVENIDGVNVLAESISGLDVKQLRHTLDQLKNQLGSAIIMLASVNGDKISLIAGITADLTDRFKADQLIREVAAQLGGKGGGRADMAQGGGTDSSLLPQAIAFVKTWVRERGEAKV